MSVKVIPRHIRTRILTNILTRLEPIATQKQKGMIDQIKRLIDQEDFDDQYDDVETGRVKGKEFINEMESRRQNPITMREIMHKDQELGEWYDSI
jgi:hypothetical protein